MHGIVFSHMEERITQTSRRAVLPIPRCEVIAARAFCKTPSAILDGGKR